MLFSVAVHLVNGGAVSSLLAAVSVQQERPGKIRIREHRSWCQTVPEESPCLHTVEVAMTCRVQYFQGGEIGLGLHYRSNWQSLVWFSGVNKTDEGMWTVRIRGCSSMSPEQYRGSVTKIVLKNVSASLWCKHHGNQYRRYRVW